MIHKQTTQGVTQFFSVDSSDTDRALQSLARAEVVRQREAELRREAARAAQFKAAREALRPQGEAIDNELRAIQPRLTEQADAIGNLVLQLVAAINTNEETWAHVEALRTSEPRKSLLNPCIFPSRAHFEAAAFRKHAHSITAADADAIRRSVITIIRSF